ncbi:MAG: dolichol-phosphate mannosyltransferase [Anaerolinea sp.]|nr:dolichol-phosphate mannosyltransferase [Anaerolinea sp.]
MIVSIILPTYNESGNIVALIEQIIQNIPENWDYEIIVVDDNSPDQTYSIVQKTFKDNEKIKPIIRAADRGLAKSIRAGIELATGSKIIVMDTDFTHDPVEIPKMLHISKLYDIVSASRFCAGGKMQSLRHYLASFVFNLLIRLILRTQVQDNLGGYFILSKEKINLLPFDSIFFGYGDYYFRLLHYAQVNRLSLVEIPASYRSRESGISKSSFLKMLFTYTSALLKLRIETRHSKYTIIDNHTR